MTHKHYLCGFTDNIKNMKHKLRLKLERQTEQNKKVEYLELAIY